MALSFRKQGSTPDQARLAQLGASVRARLQANPHMHKLPVEQAEIYAMGAFLTAGECFRLKAMIDAVAQPSTLFEGSSVPGYRTSFSGNLDRNDPYIRMIERRMDDLLGIEPEWGETVQGQRYEPGQQYKAHNDWFHPNTRYWQQERKRGGQRSWTAMIFLNDVEEGGQTQFITAGVTVTPQAGALLTWNNATPEGAPNEATLHAGLPPVAGTKYILTKWYRTRKWS